MAATILYSLLDGIAPRLLDRRIARAFARPRRGRASTGLSPDPLGEPAFRTIRGTHVAVWSRGTGAPVVLVHGWEASHRDLDAFAEALLGLGYRVVTVDLPGHGRSSGDRLSIPAIADVLEDVISTECQGSAAGIIAHSLGGAGTFVALARSGARIPAVLIAAPTRAKTYLLNMLRALCLPEERYAQVRIQYRNLFGLDLEDLDAVRDARRVRSPILLLYGGKDRMVPFAEGARYRDHLSEARLDILPEAGHRRILRDERAITSALQFIAGGGVLPAPAQPARPSTFPALSPAKVEPPALPHERPCQ